MYLKVFCFLNSEFTLTTAAEVLFTNDLTMTYTTFEWKESPNISASAVIIDEVNTTLSVMSDNIKKIGSFNVTTDNLSTKVFGVYHILLIITNINGDHLENLVLKYEETISNISVSIR